MQRDKRMWLLDCHDILNGALRRVINLEEGALHTDYMVFERSDSDYEMETDYIVALQNAEMEIHKAFDALESLCRRYRVVPDMRCPR